MSDPGWRLQSPVGQDILGKDAESLQAGGKKAGDNRLGTDVRTVAHHRSPQGKPMDDRQQGPQSIRMQTFAASQIQKVFRMVGHQRPKCSEGLVPARISKVRVWTRGPLRRVSFWAPTGSSTNRGVLPKFLPPMRISAPEGALVR